MKVVKKMKTGKKWYQSVSNWIVLVACVILIPILIMNLSIMFQAKTNEDAVPSIFGYKPFMVLSGSMETEIRKGDLIITKIVDPTTLKKEDVIAFRDASGTVTTHRIIDLVIEDGKTYFITKGDNNSSQDRNLVELSDVEGIYVGRIPGIGSIMKSLSEPTTIIIAVLIITMAFIIGFMLSTKKQRENDRLEYLEFKRMKEQEELKKQEEDLALAKEFEEFRAQKNAKKTTSKTDSKTNSKKTTSKTGSKTNSKKTTSKTVSKTNSKNTKKPSKKEDK